MKKTHRGFTIAELVVTIAVSTVLISCVVALVASFRTQVKTKQYETDLRVELSHIKRDMRDAFATFDFNTMGELSTEQNPELDGRGHSKLLMGSSVIFDILFQTEEAPCVITCYTATGESKTIESDFLERVVFETSADPTAPKSAIKVNAVYRDAADTEQVFSFMLIKRSVTP